MTRASEHAFAQSRQLHEVLSELPGIEGMWESKELKALCDPTTYTSASAQLMNTAPRE